MNATAQAPVKMIASFERGIFIPLIGDRERPEKVHATLKDANARIGLDGVKRLMAGQEGQIKDFELLTVYGHHVPAVDPQQVSQPAPVRRPPIPITGPQSTAMISGSPQIARGRGREYPPSGEIRPLKRGTVYAQLMEMLINGATMKELLGATTNATAGGVNDVLSWQIKHRGYGLRFEQATGKYFLVLPPGHRALTYKD